MRPSGPLPPRVYWVRRLLVLCLVISLVLAVWWLLTSQGNGRSRSAAAEIHHGLAKAGATQTSQPTSRPPKTPTTSAGSPSAGPTSHTTSAAEQGPDSSAGPPGHPGHRPGKPPGNSPGNCDPSQVDMSIDVSDSVEGRSSSATFVFQLPRSAVACTLAITPDTMVTRVTSGPDVVWSSGECPDALLAKEIVVRADPATVYQFQWNGRRSTQECKVPGKVAPPGGYWVEAALVGGEPHKAYFDITAPRSRQR